MSKVIIIGSHSRLKKFSLIHINLTIKYLKKIVKNYYCLNCQVRVDSGNLTQNDRKIEVRDVKIIYQKYQIQLKLNTAKIFQYTVLFFILVH